MNKLLIVLLALCLVSVHAFVKREAPAAAQAPNYLDEIQKKLQEFSNSVKDSINPDVIKQNFNQFVDGVGKLFDDKGKPAA